MCGAVADVNGDGTLDIVLIDSTHVCVYSVNAAGDWQLTNSWSSPDVVFQHGCTCDTADVDADGDMDVFMSAQGSSLLLINDGIGNFIDRASDWGLRSRAGTAMFADVDGDADTDLPCASMINPRFGIGSLSRYLHVIVLDRNGQ